MEVSCLLAAHGGLEASEKLDKRLARPLRISAEAIDRPRVAREVYEPGSMPTGGGKPDSFVVLDVAGAVPLIEAATRAPFVGQTGGTGGLLFLNDEAQCQQSVDNLLNHESFSYEGGRGT